MTFTLNESITIYAIFIWLFILTIYYRYLMKRETEVVNKLDKTFDDLEEER